jgi:hypothetical protein
MGTEKIEATAQSGEEALSFAAVARRRMLLKGVGKGVAVMAATVPIQTLATQPFLTKDGQHQCTVSGAMSGVHSTTPNSTPTCRGNTPTFYQTLSNWPNYKSSNQSISPKLKVGSTNVDETTPFATVFGGGSATTLFSLLTSTPASDEAVWVTALLNAFKNPVGFNFPYTSAQVVAYYSSAQAAQALTFFKTYMQTG